MSLLNSTVATAMGTLTSTAVPSTPTASFFHQLFAFFGDLLILGCYLLAWTLGLVFSLGIGCIGYFLCYSMMGQGGASDEHEPDGFMAAALGTTAFQFFFWCYLGNTDDLDPIQTWTSIGLLGLSMVGVRASIIVVWGVVVGVVKVYRALRRKGELVGEDTQDKAGVNAVEEAV